MASAKPDIETVDDTDPRIEYTGSWRQGGVAIEFNSTTHGTVLKDSQARFIFNGSSVAVYGTIDHKPPPQDLNPVSTYTIDGSAPETFSIIEKLPDVLHRQLFYQSSILENKEHVLIVTSTVSDRYFWLDYFQISHASPPLSSTCPTPTQTKSVSVSQGVIAGATVGGSVVVALAGAIIWIILRRRARRRLIPDMHSVQPFNYSNSDTTPSAIDFEQPVGGYYPVPNRHPQFTTGSGGWPGEKLRATAQHLRTPENSYHGLVPGYSDGNQH